MSEPCTPARTTDFEVLPGTMGRQTFHDAALHLARTRGADLFLSGPGFEDAHRSLVALEPVDELLLQDPALLDRSCPGNSPANFRAGDQDSWNRDVAQRIKDFCFNTPGPALGWLGYELGMRLRGVPVTKPCELPLGVLRKYACLVEHDARTGRVRCMALPSCRALVAVREALARNVAQHPGLRPGLKSDLKPGQEPNASLDRQAYTDAVRTVLGYIRGGHTYQLNLSLAMQTRVQGLDPLTWFGQLLYHYPAPFYVWFPMGEQRIISTSPERFLQVRQGHVLAQPIKGTLRVAPGRPAQVAALQNSPKEDAELSMIVDLLRNDISTHCRYGSVRVERHKHVFQVDDLLQMASDVRGRLRPGSDCLDLLLDALPGGSVTGCPKRRSMRIIDELEPHARGVYCGAFVYVQGPGDLESSIGIRTAVHNARTETLRFWAGSGIVAASDPEAEYLETLAKAGKFLAGAHDHLA